MSMVVNARAAKRCCAYCSTDYGHIGSLGCANRKAARNARKSLRRAMKRREKQRKEWLLLDLEGTEAKRRTV